MVLGRTLKAYIKKKLRNFDFYTQVKCFTTKEKTFSTNEKKSDFDSFFKC